MTTKLPIVDAIHDEVPNLPYSFLDNYFQHIEDGSLFVDGEDGLLGSIIDSETRMWYRDGKVWTKNDKYEWVEYTGNFDEFYGLDE